MGADTALSQIAACAVGLVSGWAMLFVTGHRFTAWLVRLAWPLALTGLAAATGCGVGPLLAGFVIGALLHVATAARIAGLAAAAPAGRP